MPKHKTITLDNLEEFDDWMLYNPDVTQEDRETIIEFVVSYLKELS